VSISFRRPSKLLRTVAALAMLSLLAIRSADAEIIYWNGTASPGNVWSDTNAWSTTTGAVTPPPIAPPGASDDVVFNISTDNENETVRLNGAQSALSILFRSTGTTTLLGGTNGTPADNTLTIGSGGITLQAGGVAVTIGQAASPGQVAVALGGRAAPFTWLKLQPPRSSTPPSSTSLLRPSPSSLPPAGRCHSLRRPSWSCLPARAGWN
jgi:hypothetical protein